MKIIRIILAMFFMVSAYFYIVSPEKKTKNKVKIHKRHGALKVVFGGCLMLILLSCSKGKYTPQPKYLKCDNWIGTWFCFDGDSIMKDSLVIDVKEYGNGYVKYKCNVSELDSLLVHPCPYKPTSDDIHIVYKGKNMYFRYFH